MTKPLNLPKDLIEAEQMMLDALIAYLNSTSDKHNYLSLNLKFEALRIPPILFRLLKNLEVLKYQALVLFPDPGASSLAKRDYPEHKDIIFTFKEYLGLSKDQINGKNIIANSPQPYDFDEYEALCKMCDNDVIMMNGKLEDRAVGIGSVGRNKRINFINKWNTIYYLEPISGGALMMAYPFKWNLYSNSPAGYIYKDSFDRKPDDETILTNL